MIRSILPTNRERWLAVAFVALWAFLFLPNLRTNPNWYGDEGDWMEKSWTFIHGTPRVGPVSNDFVFPFPYPPLYMLINGALLRAFGNDIGVSRTLGAVTALAAAVILFWIGSRLRDRKFGFLCAAAFLAYSEANANFRWVRSHPMAGTLALASVGFLIRYVQEKKWRDIVWAGVMCSLATATNYFTYPLIGAVIITAAVVNPVTAKMPFLQTLKQRTLRVGVAAAAAGAYGMIFVAWYSATRGWGHLMTQVHLLTAVAGNEMQPTVTGELARIARSVWRLGFETYTQGPPLPWSGHDWWLTVATVGFLFLPARNWRLRLWVPFWLLVLMYGVFKKLNNVTMFFYPATIFLPLMAVGFAGVLAWIEELAKRIASKSGDTLATALAILVLGGFGLQSASGAWGHFHTRIDMWTQQSVTEAEAAMRFVNSHTTKDDFVLAPKQVYWLAQSERRSLLTFCARYEGIVNDMPTAVLESHDSYWFDCRCQNAKYLVMASGVDTSGGRTVPIGIDLVYGSGLAGVPERVEALLNDGWQPVYVGGSGKMAIVDMRGHKWPVVVNGEYLVLANPRLAIAGQK